MSAEIAIAITALPGIQHLKALSLCCVLEVWERTAGENFVELV